MEILLATLFVLLALFDGWFTEHRLRLMGEFIELNRLLKWLVPKLGLTTAIVLSITVPAFALCGLLLWFKRTLPLSIFTGMRIQLFIGQLKTLELEAEFIKQLNNYRANLPKPPET